VVDVEALQRENAQLREQVSALTRELAKLNDRITELLAVAQRRHRKPAVEKPPQMAAEVTAEDRQTFDVRPKPPPKVASTEQAKSRAKPTGRQPVPQHLEPEEHALRPERCAHCGSAALDAADVIIEEKHHVVKEHQRRRVVRRTTCRCRACGERTTPRSLSAPYERSKVTCEWLAWLVYSKFVLLTPLDRIRRDLGERQIPIAMGTLVSLIERAADLLAPIDGLHWRQLLNSNWMATDGTGLKVLIPQLPVAHNGYIELYRNQELAVFQYEPEKSSESVVSKLTSFRGALTADAEHRFNAVFASGAVKESGCNAHGQHDFERWLKAVEPTLLPSEQLMTAVRYYKNHRDALFRFIDDHNVPIDNSPTEREFQNVAKLRFNMLFAGSTEGAHRACVLRGIAATCRAMGVPVQAYLAWAFERLGTHRDLFGLDLNEMTPAAYMRSHG
jgi:hypothetical protein